MKNAYVRFGKILWAIISVYCIESRYLRKEEEKFCVGVPKGAYIRRYSLNERLERGWQYTGGWY
jgi:hypothetical protein